VLLLLVVLAFAGGHDRTPPVFGGLDRATTCIPGPIGGDRLSRYHLTWQPARDNLTPRSRIVYDIYMAATPGAETFAHATYTSAAGATSFATPLLSSVQQHYFVVRARDAARNRDRNKREQLGTNLCL
jgi:hypothetical protein